MADIKNTKNLCTVATDVVSDSTNFIVEDNKEYLKHYILLDAEYQSW